MYWKYSHIAFFYFVIWFHQNCMFSFAEIITFQRKIYFSPISWTYIFYALAVKKEQQKIKARKENFIFDNIVPYAYLKICWPINTLCKNYKKISLDILVPLAPWKLPKNVSGITLFCWREYQLSGECGHFSMWKSLTDL